MTCLFFFPNAVTITGNVAHTPPRHQQTIIQIYPTATKESHQDSKNITKFPFV